MASKRPLLIHFLEDYNIDGIEIDEDRLSGIIARILSNEIITFDVPIYLPFKVDPTTPKSIKRLREKIEFDRYWWDGGTGGQYIGIKHEVGDILRFPTGNYIVIKKIDIPDPIKSDLNLLKKIEVELKQE